MLLVLKIIRDFEVILMKNTLILLIFIFLTSIFFVGCPTNPIKKYTITITVNGNGNVERIPIKSNYDSGDIITLTAEASEGWKFNNWMGDLTGNSNPATITMNSDKEVTAVFDEKKFSLIITKTGEGDVTKNPSKTEYDYQEQITLTATPNEGWSFSGWYENDLLLSTANPFNIQIQLNREIDGRFAINEYTLVTNAENGIINRTPNLATYEYGMEVLLEAEADEGYEFKNWTGDLIGNINPATITMDENKEVTGLFEIGEYGLTLESTGNGIVSNSPVLETYIYGTEVTLTATPDEGWQFIRWTGDFESIDNPATLLINESKTITALFNKEELDLTTNIWGSGEISIYPEKDKYANGERITITATPYSNWHAVGICNLGTDRIENSRFIKNGHSTWIATLDDNAKVLFEFKPGPENDPLNPDPIIFDDSNFEQAVRDLIGKQTGSIYPSDVTGIKNMYIGFMNITSIKGIEYFIDLTRLDTSYNSIVNIEYLKGLYYLTDLNLGKNELTNISSLSNLNNLTNLFLSDNEITDISILSDLKNLISLYLTNNDITNITSLENLTKLELLRLRENKISDISVLESLTNLADLSLYNNLITDVSPLENLSNLTNLLLSFNQIVDISPLSNLINLELLFLRDNEISNISILENLINLENLDLSENEIADISSLASLTNLEYLELWDNLITDISPLESLLNLKWLHLWDNLITDISPLENLINLERLHLGGNQISNISTLEYLINLEYLQLWTNQIIDISPLENLINLELLTLDSNEITDILPLENLINLTQLSLSYNLITDILPLVNNIGLDEGDFLDIRYNLLNLEDPLIQQYITDLQTRIGADFYYEPQN